MKPKSIENKAIPITSYIKSKVRSLTLFKKSKEEIKPVIQHDLNSEKPKLTFDERYELVNMVLSTYHNFETLELEITPSEEKALVSYSAKIENGYSFTPLHGEVIERINLETKDVKVNASLESYKGFESWEELMKMIKINQAEVVRLKNK